MSRFLNKSSMVHSVPYISEPACSTVYSPFTWILYILTWTPNDHTITHTSATADTLPYSPNTFFIEPTGSLHGFRPTKAETQCGGGGDGLLTARSKPPFFFLPR